MRVNLYKVAIFIFAIITILILSATIIIVKNGQDSKQLNKISSVSNTQSTPTLTPQITSQNTEENINQTDSDIQSVLNEYDKELLDINNSDASDDNVTL